MDGLLEVGGVWVNLGPLNWRKEARLKLTWEEIVGSSASQQVCGVSFRSPFGNGRATSSCRRLLEASLRVSKSLKESQIWCE